MNKFTIELLPFKDICFEMSCLVCNNLFATELDVNVNVDNDGLPNFYKDVIYCSECEEVYEFESKIEFNKFEISFEDNIDNGILKYSNNNLLEDIKFSSPFISRKFYYRQIERLIKILEIQNEEYAVDQSLNRLVFSGVITSLETYLNEVFTLIVFESGNTFGTFVSQYEPYKKEKFSLNEIFLKYDKLEIRVKDDLDSIVYHNIPKLIKIFNIYNFELNKFNDIQKISRHIQLRHNLIHKSGLDEYDNFQTVTKEDVKTLIKEISSFVEYINEKIEKKCYIPDYDLDTPF